MLLVPNMEILEASIGESSSSWSSVVNGVAFACYAYYGGALRLKEVPEIVELSHSGKLSGKGIVIVDQRLVDDQ